MQGTAAINLRNTHYRIRMIPNKMRVSYKSIWIAGLMSVLVFAGQQVSANMNPENKDDSTE